MSSFAAVTITSATPGRHQTLNVNVGGTDLLQWSTYVGLVLMPGVKEALGLLLG